MRRGNCSADRTVTNGLEKGYVWDSSKAILDSTHCPLRSKATKNQLKVIEITQMVSKVHWQHKQIYKGTNKQTNGWIKNKQTKKWPNKEMNKRPNERTKQQTNKKMNKQTDGQTNKQKNKQTDKKMKKTNKQRNKRINKQTTLRMGMIRANKINVTHTRNIILI